MKRNEMQWKERKEEGRDVKKRNEDDAYCSNVMMMMIVVVLMVTGRVCVMYYSGLTEAGGEGVGATSVLVHWSTIIVVQ